MLDGTYDMPGGGRTGRAIEEPPATTRIPEEDPDVSARPAEDGH
jgi:hypothetical protein